MSDEFGLRGPKLPWACPNDRQLALRAKLKTGWSIKTNQFSTYPKPAPLTEREQQMIVSVVKKAEELDLYEQQRVGKLVDRLESLKKLANGNGVTECVLCGDTFGLSVFGRSNYKCHDCEKAVCRKCVVEISTLKPGSTKEQLVRLCKVCSENRELIKKSGAWFYKGVPKYILPEKKNHYTNSYEKYAASPRSYQEQKYVSRYINSKQGGGGADKEPSSSSNSFVTGAQAVSSSVTASTTTTTTTTAKTATTSSSSNNSNSSATSNRPGGFFWSRNLQNRPGGGSSQQTPATTEESSSGDECGSNFLKSSTGGTKGSSGHGGPKSYTPHHDQSNISLSYSPGAATTVSSSNGSNHNGSNWSGMSMSRGHSPPASRLLEHKSNTSPLRTSTDTSPGDQTPQICLIPDTALVHNQSLEGGQDTPAFTAAVTTTTTSTTVSSGSTECRYGSSLDLSSSSSKQIARVDGSSRETLNTDQRNGDGVHTPVPNNGDNNPKSSTSSSNDCLYQQQQQQSPSPLGFIQITVLYDDSHQALHCSVQFAKDLVPTDINGLSDPYCILKLIPSRYEGTHLRTKTMHKTVNPIFNETLTFYGVTMHDLTWQTLQILVMDDDRWGKDCLGTTQIPLHRLRSQQTRSFTQSLERGRLVSSTQ